MRESIFDSRALIGDNVLAPETNFRASHWGACKTSTSSSCRPAPHNRNIPLSDKLGQLSKSGQLHSYVGLLTDQSRASYFQ